MFAKTTFTFNGHLIRMFSTLRSLNAMPGDRAMKNILIVKKPKDTRTKESLLSIAHWIKCKSSLKDLVQVHVESRVFQELTASERIGLNPFSNSKKDAENTDLVVTLGGDGTLLHVNSLFPSKCPPIVSFSLGSLGFLMPFDFTLFPSVLGDIFQNHETKKSLADPIEENCNLTIMDRLRIEVEVLPSSSTFTSSSITFSSSSTFTSSSTSSSSTLTSPSSSSSSIGNLDKKSKSSLAKKSWIALNDVMLHRGRFPNLVTLECHVDGTYLTDAIADGIIVASPSGSTAYSLSAGGSIVHPLVSSLLLTPICPRSLSFRPAIFPDTSVIDIKICDHNRGSVDLSVDGDHAASLSPGSRIRIRKSRFPMPTLLRGPNDWIQDLNDLLGWNQNFKSTND